MVLFCATKMSTKNSDRDLGAKRKISCFPEDKIISLTAGDNGDFISAKILLQMNIKSISNAYLSGI